MCGTVQWQTLYVLALGSSELSRSKQFWREVVDRLKGKTEEVSKEVRVRGPNENEKGRNQNEAIHVTLNVGDKSEEGPGKQGELKGKEG